MKIAFVLLIIGTINSVYGCDESVCQLPDCKCISLNSPVNNPPQLVTLSFDESVQTQLLDDYHRPILFNRTNPDGHRISGTFYVPHTYTNYVLVNELYNNNFEIALHSVTKNVLQSYWKHANLTDLLQEFGDERQIVSRFANVPAEHITGARTPHFQFSGNSSFEALTQSDIQYDNSWPTYSTHPYFPYTFDYGTNQTCITPECPTGSFAGFWVLPIVNFWSPAGHECNVLVSCRVNGTAQIQFDWLKSQFLKTYEGNRAPLNYIVTSSWFDNIANSLEAYKMFLDYLDGLEDVYLVSSKQVVDWMKNPVPASEYSSAVSRDPAPCPNPRTCALPHIEEMRYMGSCAALCPNVYPWLGNPTGA